MQQSFVYSAAILLVATSITVSIFRHFGLGSVFGLLIAGVFIGPHTPGPRIMADVEHLRQFTELGIVLLLFLIGLEMQPHRLWSMRREMFGLGTAQIFLSSLLIAIYSTFILNSWRMGLLFGLALAMSSTAFVMQILQERGEIASQQGQTSFAILLMQDLAVVPLLALVPILSEAHPLLDAIPRWQQVVLLIGILGALISGGYFFIRPALDYLARQHNREGFFLVVLAAVFVAAWSMEQVGLSMALGAFIMGMMLSNSSYHYHIQASIEPHKGLLMSLFFVAVGMSIDLGEIIKEPLLFTTHIIGVVLIKLTVLFILCLLFSIERKIAMQVAFLLSQGGEFGFVLLGSAKALHVINNNAFTIGIGIISVTMLFTPLLVYFSDKIAISFKDNASKLGKNYLVSEATASSARVILAGYGRMGHTVGTIFASSGIPFIAIDANPARVAYWQQQEHPVYYGDISDAHLLDCLHLERIELMVMTLQNDQVAVRAAHLIRHLAPSLPIFARAGDLSACDQLVQAGVTRALPETLEASLRLAAESLEILGIGNDDTDTLIRDVRKTDYDLLRDG